ncbi:MAG: hypothetical protein OSA45_16175 [Halioglobus sp.]|nr:hypothetical protein [Halioglobus sp.]
MKKQYRLRALILTLLLAIFGYSPAWAADSVQTQMSLSGDLDVDVLKASVLDDVFTVVLAYRNNGETDAKIKYKVDEVYFIDDIEKKKYHVLKDSKNEWIGAPISRGQVGIGWPGGVSAMEITAGGKKLVWFKFPAPPAAAKSLTLVIPDVLPFEELAVSR